MAAAYLYPSVCAFFIYLVNSGSTWTFGVVMPELVLGLDCSQAQAAVTSAIQQACLYGPAVFASGVVDVLECHRACLIGSTMAAFGLIISAFTTNIFHLYVTHGVITGLGMCLQFQALLAAIPQTVPERRRSLVTGFVVSSSGVGMFAYAPMCRLLMDAYGWRGMYLITGALMMNTVPLSVSFRPTKNSKITENQKQYFDEPHEVINGDYNKDDLQISHVETQINTISHSNGVQKDSNGVACDRINSQNVERQPSSNDKHEEDESNQKHQGTCSKHMKTIFDLSLLKHKMFSFILVSVLFLSLGVTMPFTFLPSKAKELDISSLRASFLISAIGVSDCVGRFVSGIVGSYISSLVLLTAGNGVMGAAMIWLYFAESYAVIMVCAVVFGILFGNRSVMYALLGPEFVGVEKAAKAAGMIYSVVAIAVTTAPYIGAVLWESTDSASTPFLYAGCTCLVAGMAGMLCIAVHRRHVIIFKRNRPH